MTKMAPLPSVLQCGGGGGSPCLRVCRGGGGGGSIGAVKGALKVPVFPIRLLRFGDLKIEMLAIPRVTSAMKPPLTLEHAERHNGQ
jgi:hypothetical protein